MDTLHSRISLIVNNRELSDADKVVQIKEILTGSAVVPIPGIVERLVATPKSQGGYDWVDQNLTDANFPVQAEPSLEGARLDPVILGSRVATLAALKRDGRRSAICAELLLYGTKNPEEQRKVWIWSLAQVWVDPACIEYSPVLGVRDVGRRGAYLGFAEHYLLADHRVLSFPMTEAELVQRDAEVAERRNA